MQKQLLVVPALALAGLLFGACSLSGNQPEAEQPTTQQEQGKGGPQGSGQPNPSGAPQMDYAAAAVKLGVTEADLKAAMQGTDGKRASMADVAKTLNVTEEALRTALGIPANTGNGPQQGRPQGSPPPAEK